MEPNSQGKPAHKGRREDRRRADAESLLPPPGTREPRPRGFSSQGDFVTGCAVGTAILLWAYLHYKMGWPWFGSSLPSLAVLAAAVLRLIVQIRRER